MWSDKVFFDKPLRKTERTANHIRHSPFAGFMSGLAHDVKPNRRRHGDETQS